MSCFFTPDDVAVRSQSRRSRVNGRWTQNRKPPAERIKSSINHLRSHFRKGEPEPRVTITYFVSTTDGNPIMNGLDAHCERTGENYAAAIERILQQAVATTPEGIEYTVEQEVLVLPSTEGSAKKGIAITVTLGCSSEVLKS